MNRTKDIISEAFTQLLDEKAISKITVKDIVDRCGVNRNTFYYHFQDIPTLCEYIWQNKIDDLIQNHLQPDSPGKVVSVAVNFFNEHKTAVLHVYKSLPRDIFLQYLNQLALYLVNEYIDTACADEPLSPSSREFVVRYYKCTLIGMFIDWLDSGMSYDLFRLALMISDLRSEAGRDMIARISTQEEDCKVPS